ncbi:hypothetical protein AB0F15_06720 [Amycolatopsis sp. NPDC026612]|uniref:hypothetical protein n=1 Tax=Amycolatopsis sp. NPDC026612 TaxID=3155466 RepID=UPI0033DBD229
MGISMKVTAVAAAAAAAVLAGAPAAGAAPATVAAPSGFDVSVHHASGTLVGRVQGNLSWSTSGRTVIFTNQQLYVRDGECVRGAYAGYQSNTRVTGIPGFETCRPGSTPLPDLTLPTDVPGGIQHVIIDLTDVTHDPNGGARASDDCWKSESVCRSRP